MNAQVVITLGAMPAQVPHSRMHVVHASSANPERTSDQNPTSTAGPTASAKAIVPMPNFPPRAIPPASADSSIAAQLAILLLPDGLDRIQVQGLSGRRYVIQVSTDLLDWSSVATNASDSGTIQWTDPQAADHPARFYRALAP